jgi:hypothetical protein
MRKHSAKQEIKLPRKFQHLFWDAHFKEVSWREHFKYIVQRLLSVGGPETVNWLRKKAGDAAIRRALMSFKSRGVSYEQAATWISKQQYDDWIAENPNRVIWVPCVSGHFLCFVL